MDSSQPAFPNCDTEAIEFLSQIQNQGVLLIVDAVDYRLMHASENAGTFTQTPLETRWNQPIDDILPADVALALRELREGPPQILTRLESDRTTSVLLQRTGKWILIETEPNQEADEADLSPLSWQSRLQACQTETELNHTVAAAVDDVLQLQRTMVYRFEPDKSGVVMSEILHGNGPEYLGLRFPAGDIPDNARKLYIQNRIRLIHDVGAGTIPVRSAPGAGIPNLQHARLRAVAPVHLQYLKNMGVQAAVSFPIVVQGQLWGLLSCHHDQPLRIGMARRECVCRIVEEFSNRLRQLRLSAGMKFLDFKSQQTGGLVSRLYTALPDPPPASLSEELMGSAGAEGLAVRYQDTWHLFGNTPEEGLVSCCVPGSQREARSEPTKPTPSFLFRLTWMPAPLWLPVCYRFGSVRTAQTVWTFSGLNRNGCGR